MNTLKFVKIADVKSPCRAHPTDAGIDFFVPNDFENGGRNIEPGESVLIGGGLKVSIPKGYVLIFFNKSGVAAKKNLVLGSCVVDESYQGELMYNLHNIGTKSVWVSSGDKIVQGILLPVNYANVEEIGSVEELYGGVVSDRGEGGFGSSGVK